MADPPPSPQSLKHFKTRFLLIATGLFFGACSHGLFKAAVTMDRGEIFGYPYAILKDVLEKHSVSNY